MDTLTSSVASPGGSRAHFVPSTRVASEAVSPAPALVLSLAATDSMGDSGPEAMIGPDTAHAVESVRNDMGVRIERTLAALAYRAAARGMKVLPVAEPQGFLPAVQTELNLALDLRPTGTAGVLGPLARELHDFVKGNEDVSGDWGKLSTTEEGGLVIHLNPVAEPEAPSRERAKLVEGSAH